MGEAWAQLSSSQNALGSSPGAGNSESPEETVWYIGSEDRQLVLQRASAESGSLAVLFRLGVRSQSSSQEDFETLRLAVKVYRRRARAQTMLGSQRDDSSCGKLFDNKSSSYKSFHKERQLAILAIQPSSRVSPRCIYTRLVPGLSNFVFSGTSSGGATVAPHHLPRISTRPPVARPLCSSLQLSAGRSGQEPVQKF